MEMKDYSSNVIQEMASQLEALQERNQILEQDNAEKDAKLNDAYVSLREPSARSFRARLPEKRSHLAGHQSHPQFISL